MFSGPIAGTGALPSRFVRLFSGRPHCLTLRLASSILFFSIIEIALAMCRRPLHRMQRT